MSSARFAWLTVFVTSIVLNTGPGCPGPSSGDANLSDNEQAGIEAGLGAMASLASATSAAQTTPLPGSRPIPEGRTVTEGCPTITIDVNGLTESVTLDFGTGCTPTCFPETTCSGNAGGTLTISQQGLSLSLEFNDLVVGDKTMAGTLDASITSPDSGVTLSGDWDLAWSHGDEQVTTSGEGDCEITVVGTYGASIPVFMGTATNANGTYTVTVVEEVKISYHEYGNFIPDDGIITVECPALGTRKLWLRFGETSPTDLEVEVSFDGTDYTTLSVETMASLLL